MEKQERHGSYRVITDAGCGEIVEKKSRFIASLMPVGSEEEALAFIASVRRKYYDARHNCFAFITGEDGETERCSDDGEPSGSAGRPMLEVLRGMGLTNTAAVVTRYFGGTLLGTGGLVRAYTQAVQAALENCTVITMHSGVRFYVTIDYALTGKLQHLFAERQIMTDDTVYTDKVRYQIIVPYGQEEAFQKELTELTAAQVWIEKAGTVYYQGRGTE